MCYFLNGKTKRLCSWPWTTSLCHLQSTPTLEDHLGDLSRPAFFQRTEVLIVLFQWPIYFFSPFLEFGIGSGTQIFKQTLNVIKLISMPCIYFLFFNLINIRIGWRCCFRSFWEYFHSSEQSGGSSCQHLQCCRPQVDGTSEWSRCHSLVSGVATIGTCTLAVDWAQTL